MCAINTWKLKGRKKRDEWKWLELELQEGKCWADLGVMG